MTSAAHSACPDLHGVYACSESVGPWTHLEFSQGTNAHGATTYTFNEDKFIVDGEIKIEEWSVPQCAGGILLMQSTCEDGAFVQRSGLEYFFNSEHRFSKDATGALIVEMYELQGSDESASGQEIINILEPLEKMFKAFEKGSGKLTKDEAFTRIKEILKETGLPLWNILKEKGLLKKTRVECRNL
jgi:hypothetical protein